MVKKLTIDGNRYTYQFSMRKTGKVETFVYDKKYGDEERYWGRKDLRGEISKASPFVKRYKRYILNDIYPKNTIHTITEVKAVGEKSIEEMVKEVKTSVGVNEVEYLMPQKERKIVLSSLKRGKNVLLVGASGCGKSKMVLELAKQEGKIVSRLPLNGGCTDASFIGEKGLRVNEKGDSETFFQYGILPTAMKNGNWLLLDELDFCQPEYLATLQAVFEGGNTPLTISDNGGEKIYPHKDFRIIATANTLGRGDTNWYHGTNMLNIATLDRWTIITMDYTPQENKLLEKIVNSEIANKMVAVAKRIRNAIKIGELPDYVFSTRRLLHWAEAVVDLGFELGTEAEVLGRLLTEERKIIGEFIYDTFGKRV